MTCPTPRKLTATEQDEVQSLMPYAAHIACRLASRDPDAVSEAHLALCGAVLACQLTDPDARRRWVGNYVHDEVYQFLQRQQKGVADTKRRLGYTPHRPLSTHDVIARLPSHLRTVALARWTDKHRRTPWRDVASEMHVTIPEARQMLVEARVLARGILNDEATNDVLQDNGYPDSRPPPD